MNNSDFFILDFPYINDLNASRSGYAGSFDQNTPIAFFDASLRAFQQRNPPKDIIEVIENPPYSNPQVEDDGLIIDLETGKVRRKTDADILRDGGVTGKGQDAPPSFDLGTIGEQLNDYLSRGGVLIFAILILVIAIYRIIK